MHGIIKQKMILRNFKLHMRTSQNVLHLGTNYIVLKVSKEKDTEEKQDWFELKKGERNTRKE